MPAFLSLDFLFLPLFLPLPDLVISLLLTFDSVKKAAELLSSHFLILLQNDFSKPKSSLVCLVSLICQRCLWLWDVGTAHVWDWACPSCFPLPPLQWDLLLLICCPNSSQLMDKCAWLWVLYFVYPCGTWRDLSRGGRKVMGFVRVELYHPRALHMGMVRVSSNGQPGGRRWIGSRALLPFPF